MSQSAENDANGPGWFWTRTEWAEWSNSLATLIPEDDVSRYANPEGAQESIVQDCLRAYIAEREALTAAAAWIADAIGYPIETRMPDHPMPQALWDALVDHVHADKTGKWHGNDLDREEVESWLADEAGRVTLSTCPCGCPADMHIGEIGCPCALPGEPPCVPSTSPEAPDPECNWPRCHRSPNPCFSWCKCRCHTRPTTDGA